MKSAFDTLITALRAASAHHVDAAGTIIGGKKQTADETNPKLSFGTVW